MGPRLSCHCAQGRGRGGGGAVVIIGAQDVDWEFSSLPHLEVGPHSHVVYEGAAQGQQRLQQQPARALVSVVADHLMAKHAGRVGTEGQPA
jgi:hypothetical protein